jgi:uncharacterized protein (TIGR00661 family)
MALAMLKAFPKIKKEAKTANQFLQKLISKKKIDIIISDNRYELYSPDAYTIFLTHQLNIQTPGFTSLVKPIIQKTIFDYIKKHDELWIPDFETKPNLSGELSHIRKMPNDNYHFIGPLSRFSLIKETNETNEIDLLIMLSGPEPQRTRLEEILIGQAIKTKYSTILLQGKPENTKGSKQNNVQIIPHVGDQEMANLIQSAKHIVCRPGYTTIMDLSVFGKKAIFIPTPGQTEQEYLAELYKKAGISYSESQNKFDLLKSIDQQKNYKGLITPYGEDILENSVLRILSEKFIR